MTAPTIQNLSLTYTTSAAPLSDVAGFDGDVTVTATPGNIPNGSLTVELWICTTQSAAGVEILSFAGDLAANRLAIANPGALQVSLGGTSAPATGVSVADGKWHQLAVTLAPASSTTLAVGIYVDGVLAWRSLALTKRSAGAWPEATSMITLGSGFIGQMSEFRLWSGVRSASAILTDMAIRVPAGASGPLIEWPLTGTPSGSTDAGVTYNDPSPTLRFLASRTLEAEWGSAGSGVSYTMTVTGGCECPETVTVAAATTATVSETISPFTINTDYSVAVAAISSGETGTASTATVTTLDLGLPVLQEHAGTATYSVVWGAIDQASGYTASLTVTDATGTATPSNVNQTGTTLDLTAYAFGSDSCTYLVNATGTGIAGPTTDAASAPAAPTVELTYDQASGPPGTLKVTLTNTDGTIPYLVNVTPTASVTGTATQILAAGTTDASFGTYTPDNSGTQTFAATGQGVPLGAVGPAGNSTATLWNLNAPSITSVTADVNNDSVTVNFTYSGAEPTGLEFHAVLATQSDPDTDLAATDVTQSPAILTSTAVVDNAALQVRIRGEADNSKGTWPAWTQIDINAPAQVHVTSASFDSSMNATVGWDAVSGSGITYVAELYTGNRCVYQAPKTSTTSVTMDQSNTGAEKGTTYTVTVTATSGAGITGETSAPVTVSAPQETKKNRGKSGDPVDVATGSNTYGNTDISVTAVVPLLFNTYYSGVWPTTSENALIPASPLGNRWSHEYMTQLVFDDNYVYVIWGAMSLDTFQSTGSGSGYLSPAGVTPGTTLYRNGDGSYTLTQADASEYTFNSSGLLTTIIDRYGNTADLDYSGSDNQLSKITDTATGRFLSLGYDGAMLRTVTDPMGYQVIYQQSGGNLTSVTDPTGATRSFAYTGTSLMQSAVDGNGNTVFYNDYTDSKITEQQDARALADGADYGYSFSYTTQTQNGVDVIVTSGTDAEGNDFTYTSDAATGALLQVQMDLGYGRMKLEKRLYDSLNNLTSKTLYVGPSDGYTTGTGNTTEYSYDGNGNVISEVTQLTGGNVAAVSRSFDNNSNMLTESYYEGSEGGYSQGSGNTWTYTYNDDNSLKTATDPLGQVTQYFYGAHALLTQSIDSYGNVTDYDYADSDLYTVTDPLGTVTTYVDWDADGRPLTITISAGGTTLSTAMLEYDQASRIVSQSVMLAGQPEDQAFVTRYTYDNNGNLTGVTDAAGNFTQYDYNPNNYLSKTTYAAYGGLTRYVEYDYDKLNFPKSQTSSSTAAGAISVVLGVTCDALGRPVNATDPNGNTYGIAVGMTPSATGPFNAAQVTTWPTLTGSSVAYTDERQYDPLGRLISITTRGGTTIGIAYSTQYDGESGTTQSVKTVTYPATDTQGETTTITVSDALGRIVSFTDQNGQETLYAYGRMDGDDGTVWATVTITDPNSVVRLQAYDPLGRLTQDNLGTGDTQRVQSFTYDGLNRLLSQTTSQGGASTTTSYTYGYDYNTDTGTATWTRSMGRPGMTTGATLDYYDGLNRRVAQAAPFTTGTQAWSFTPWGGLASYTNGSGQTFSYQFDDAFRLLQANVPGADPIVYTLDLNGNRQTVTQGAQSIGYGYDEWNRMLTRCGVDGGTVTTAYWPGNQPRTLTYSDGSTVQYQIDGLGRLKTVLDWTAPDGPGLVYGYTLDNQIKTRTYPNGAIATYGYDDGGRLNSLDITSAGFVVAQWAAEYDTLNQLSSVTVIDPVAATMPASGTDITYADSNAVLTINGTAAVVNGDGAYIGSSATAPEITYDVFGRVTGSSLTGMPSLTYGYDPDGLLVSAAEDGGAPSSYVHDIGGYRSPWIERGDPWRALAGSATEGTLDGTATTGPVYADGTVTELPGSLNRLLLSYGSDGTLQNRFLYGLGVEAQQDADGNLSWFHPDPVGNLWAMTDSDGAVVAAAVFGPFGTPYGLSGSVVTPFGYGGQFGVLTDGSGLAFMRARHYMPAQMRFLQPDYLTGSPFRPQTLNRYAFVLGNPLQATDPLGLFGWKNVKKAIDKAADTVGDALSSFVNKFGEALGLAILGLGAIGGLAYLGDLYLGPLLNGYRPLPGDEPGGTPSNPSNPGNDPLDPFEIDTANENTPLISQAGPRSLISQLKQILPYTLRTYFYP